AGRSSGDPTPPVPRGPVAATARSTGAGRSATVSVVSDPTQEGRHRAATWFAARSAGVAGALVIALAYAVLVAAIGPAGGGVGPSPPPAIDVDVSRAFVERRGATVDAVSGAVSGLSAPSTVLAATGTAVLVLLLLRRWAAGVLLLVALPLELAVFL